MSHENREKSRIVRELLGIISGTCNYISMKIKNASFLLGKGKTTCSYLFIRICISQF